MSDRHSSAAGGLARGGFVEPEKARALLDSLRTLQPFDDDEVFMFEDSLKNLVSAKDNFNITGVLIKGKTLAEENDGSEVSKRFVQIDKPVLSELMEKVPSLFA